MIRFVTISLIVASISAIGQTIESQGNLQSVMIYNSSAEMHYTKDVLIPKGKSTIVFTQLTPYIVDNTLNVSIKDQGVEIVNVSDKINHIRARKLKSERIAAYKDSVKRLNHERFLIDCRVKAWEREKELLFRGEAIGGVAQGVSVTEIEKAANFFSNRYYQLTTDIYHSKNDMQKLADRASKYDQHIKTLSVNTAKPGSEIEITVNSERRQTVNVDFQFLTSKGGWAPSYDCRYQGPNKPIKFVFRANVFNASGTPWENVKIKLSTANPMMGFNAPSINDKGGRTVASNDGKVTFKQIQVANAIATYDIKQTQTIPSDSKPYLVDVESYEMKASFNYLLIPKLDPNGFLMAKVADWNKYNLIPGNTKVYNQGSYMGKTFLNTYSDNDTLSIYLGKDANIKTSKKEIIKTNKNNLIGNYYVEKADIKIKINNNSNVSLPVEVLDQVPVFSNKSDVKFNLHGIPDNQYIDTEGLIRWKFQLQPNDSRELAYKYDIKEPKSGSGHYAPKLRKFRTISCPSF